MVVQHPNGNSYLFIDNRVFVSTYNKTTNSVITTELDLSLPLNEWEKEQISKQPKHDCLNISNGCYSTEQVSFGKTYCTACDFHYEIMNDTDENQ